MGPKSQPAGLAAAPDAPRAAVSAGLIGPLLVALAAVLFVVAVCQLTAAEVVPARRPGGSFRIPAGATQFGALSDFEQAVTRPGMLFALTISEPELNQRIGAAIARQPDLPFRDVAARLLDGQAELTGGVRAVGLDLRPTVAVRLWADGGQLRHEVVRIGFGSVSVPGIARRAISETVQRQLDPRRLAERYVIEDLQLRHGAVTIVARAR